MKRYERITNVEKLERYSAQHAASSKQSKINLIYTIGCVGLAAANFASPEVCAALSTLLQNEQVVLSPENVFLVNGLGIAWSICGVIAGAGMVQELSRKAHLEQLIRELDDTSSQKTTESTGKRLVLK